MLIMVVVFIIGMVACYFLMILWVELVTLRPRREEVKDREILYTAYDEEEEEDGQTL